MKSIFLILIILFSTSALADLSQRECLNVDYSRRFGPVRDQDGHGYCWAFVASALAEESFCKLNRTNCGKSVSPLDISRCDWSLAQQEEGGHFGQALECGINNGVCNEGHAPYDALRSWGCTIRQLVVFRSNRCDRDILKNLFTTFRDEQRECRQDGVVTSAELRQIEALQARLISDLREKVPARVLGNRNLRQLFQTSTSADDFLQRTLIGQSCENNRRRIPGRIVFQELTRAPGYTRRETQAVLNFIKRGLSSGSSVGLSMDLGRTNKNTVLGGLITAYPRESNHAVVVTGMRWNAGRCEVNLRNSWGVGADFHGWTSISDIEGGFKSGEFLQ